MSKLTTKTTLNELTDSEVNTESAVETMNEDALPDLHPHLADVIKSIQAEKRGEEEISLIHSFTKYSKC